MIQPWEPDRSLTLDHAKEVVRTAFPPLDARDLKLLGSGWEFDAYVTSDGWVLRFPRRAHAAELFEKERRVHQLVAGLLPPTIALPRVELLAQPAAGFSYKVAAHRYIPGIPVDEVDQRYLPSLSRQIGRTLGAIHSCSEVAAREAGLTEEDTDEEGGREWVAGGLKALAGLRRTDPVVDNAAKWVERAWSRVERFAGPLRLIHQDLSPEHILADPASGELTGVLDWTDAMLGDAARDFVFLVAWRGWPFADDVLRNYPHPVDPGFRDRLRFMARLLTPLWLGFALERGTEAEKLNAWVYNAYDETGGRKQEG